LQVWDTAGQERFRSVTSAYYRGSMGAIVCYDCTDENSFTNAKQWIDEFETKARAGAPKILVANKRDLFNSERKHVESYRGEELAKEHGMTFMETSAYTAENVPKVF